MLLKRLYQKSPEGNNLVFANNKGEQLIKVGDVFTNFSGEIVVKYPEPPAGFEPVVIGVELKRLPVKENVQMTPKLLEMGKKQGWAEKTEDHILIRGYYDDQPTKFKILSEPGRYCLHCGDKLKDDPQGNHAKKHVEELHDGKPTDNEGDKSGYICNNYYLVTMEK